MKNAETKNNPTSAMMAKMIKKWKKSIPMARFMLISKLNQNKRKGKPIKKDVPPTYLDHLLSPI